MTDIPRQRVAAPGLRQSTTVVFSLLAGAVIWQGAASAGWLPRELFSSPLDAIASLWDLLRSGAWAEHVLATLGRVLSGFTLGLVSGVAIGWMVARSTRCANWIDPWLAALHPLPKIALLPLLLVLFGLGQTANLVLAALGAFFPVAISVAAGVRHLDPRYFALTASLDAPRSLVLRRVVLPGSLPAIFTGARIGLNVALTLSLAAEFVAASNGIGQQLWFAWQILDVDQVFAWLLTVAGLGLLFQAMLGRVQRTMTPWITSDRSVAL